MQDMSSNQPYLLKAFFDWIIDNGLTPYMVINTRVDGVEVPLDYVKDNQIVLNVSPNACINFYMDLAHISFQARFAGKPELIQFPCHAVSAIYAKENGAGTVFSPAHIAKKENDTATDKASSAQSEKATIDNSSKKDKKATLRVVK